MVLLDETSGLYFGLNEIASEIWSRIQSGKNEGEICADLLEEFAVPRDVLESDIRAFVDQLRAAKLLI